LLFGFPAAAGSGDGPTVRYVLIRQQKTMLAEPDGRVTSRVRELRDVFRDAGFSATISSNPSG
jgi:ketopantoate reductase